MEKKLWKLVFWVKKTYQSNNQTWKIDSVPYPHSLLGQTRFAALSLDLGLPCLPRLPAVLVWELGYCLSNSRSRNYLWSSLVSLVAFFWWRSHYDYDISFRTTVTGIRREKKKTGNDIQRCHVSMKKSLWCWSHTCNLSGLVSSRSIRYALDPRCYWQAPQSQLHL